MGMNMTCKNCGNPIFEGDRFCSGCGTRVMEMETAEASAPMADEVGGVNAKTADISTEQEKTEEEKPEEEKSEEEKAQLSKTESLEPAETDSAVHTTATGKTAGEGMIPLSIPEEKQSKAKSSLKSLFKGRSAVSDNRWVPRVVLGAFAVVVVILIANSAKLINSYHRNFSTPEEYYRWVEGRAIQKNAGTFAEYYVNYFVEYLHRYDRYVSGEIHVELGDAGREMMEQADLQAWFEEGSLTFESDSKNSVRQDTIGLEIGGEKLLSMDVIMDLKDEAVYLGFPGLTKTYLAVDTGQREFVRWFEYACGMEPEEYLESLELLEVLYRECPDRSRMEALTNKYLELLMNRVEDVKMRTGKTVRAGSITQTCTTLEFYLDKEDIRNMLTEFLEELQEDREVEVLLFQIFELADELDLDMEYYRNADEFYEAFQDNIDEILSDMEYYITYHHELNMTVYVDDKGRIIGRTVEFPNSWDEVSFSYVNPHRGSRFGYKGSIVLEDKEVSITGSGKTFGNRINGSFTVKCEGDGVVDVEVQNFDMKSLRKGYINGCFTITASSGIGRTWDLDAAHSYLTDMELKMEVSMNRSSEKWSMELRQDKELWGILTIAAKTDSGRKISVPSTRSAIFVDNDRDFEDWWDTIEWKDLVKKMNKAGLPSDTIETVEEFSEMNVDEVLEELRELMRFLLSGTRLKNALPGCAQGF